MSERANLTTKTPESKTNNLVSKTHNSSPFQSAQSPTDHILNLQRTIGNQAVQRLLQGAGSREQSVLRLSPCSPRFSPSALQAKLKIGQPNDKYEQEADRVADQVMRMEESKGHGAEGREQRAMHLSPSALQAKPLSSRITPLIQRQTEEEDRIQEKAEEITMDGPEMQTKPIDDEDPNVQLRNLEMERTEYPILFKKAPNIQKSSRGGSRRGTREQIVEEAQKMVGKIEAKKDDGSGRRVGAEHLLEIFHLAAGDAWSDEVIENVRYTDQFPHWCGIFSVYAIKKAGIDLGFWQVGMGVSSFGTLEPTDNPQPGDVGYFTEKQHHCIIKAVNGDTIESIDGNSGTFSEVIERTRPRSQFHAFFTAFTGSEKIIQKKENALVQPKLQTSLIQRQVEEEELEEDVQTKQLIQRQVDQEEEEEVQAKEILIQKPQISQVSDNQVQRLCPECEEEQQIQQKPLASTRHPVVQRQVEEEEAPEIMTKSDAGPQAASSNIQNQLNASKGSGSPLPKDTRTSMESSFGTDFSDVRVHTDSNAAQMNQGVNAQAFTHGNDVYFNKGKYNPGTISGKHLLGHELTHVVQQSHVNNKELAPKIPNILQGQDLDVGPGQEKHLPHEGWHAVQQIQGRVKPTMQTKGVSINDDKELEREADVMGGKAAVQMKLADSALVSTESTDADVATLTVPAQLSEDPNKPVYEAYKGKSINKIGHVSSPASQYKVAKSSGVNVRAKPDGTLPHIAKVVYDAEVQVQALDNTAAFYFIIAKTGAVGWINKKFVVLEPPDIGSRLHHITESNLTTILKNEYIDKKLWTLGTGNDYTTLAAAVVVANEGRKGVSVDWGKAKKYKEDNTLKRVFDPWMIDNFAIYHGSQVLTGHNIWLPSSAYVRMMQKSGVIGSRPGWINAAVDVGKGIAGFLAGVVSGVFGSLWDTLTGLWELGKGIVSTIRSVLDGSIFASIEAIYDTIAGMSWQSLKNMVNEIVTMGKSAFNDFEKKWNHPNTYKQWHFKGYIIGAIALEVVLAIFTGGGTLALKVLAKIGKYLPKLMRIFNKLLALAKKLPGRRRKGSPDKPGKGKQRDRDRDKDDKDMSKDDRAWEQARAMAALVTEGHDTKDTPVAKLIPMLNATIAARYKGVSRYKAIPLGLPHTYKIIQLARRKNVDDHYTEKKKKTPKFNFFTHLQGKSAKMIQDRARKLGWKPDRKLRSGRGWVFRDENGIERIRYRQKKSGKYHHEQTGYVRWTDEGGNLLDINGKQVTAGGTPLTTEMTQRQIRALCADEAEMERIMGASHISVDLLGGKW